MIQLGECNKRCIDAICETCCHTTYVFPEVTDLSLEVTAGAIGNAWSDWIEIADNMGNTLTDKNIVDYGILLSTITMSKASHNNEYQQIEVAYGDAKTVNARVRVYTGSVPKQYSRMRPQCIPKNEKIYVRVMAETGGATAELSLRYFYKQVCEGL